MKWHKGPPPEIGWWPASIAKDKESIRWWDGNCWSWPSHPTDNRKVAAVNAKIKSPAQELIRWTDRWWL